MPEPSLRASAQGATYLILQQLLSRGLTFAINQLLLRLLTPTLLGASVQLELYASTVLYFARESLRVALQRHRAGVQPVVNGGYLALAAGIPLSGIFGALYWQSVRGGSSSSSSSNEGDGTAEAIPYLGPALAAFGLAALVELAAEPAFVAAQQLMRFRVRAAAESTATIAKCVATCATAVWGARRGVEVGVLPFAAGQGAYAVVVLAVYVGRMRGVGRAEGFSLGLKKVEKRWVGVFFSFCHRWLGGDVDVLCVDLS
jgi:oligosaccharide translocation protein RFT1